MKIGNFRKRMSMPEIPTSGFDFRSRKNSLVSQGKEIRTKLKEKENKKYYKSS